MTKAWNAVSQRLIEIIHRKLNRVSTVTHILRLSAMPYLSSPDTDQAKKTRYESGFLFSETLNSLKRVSSPAMPGKLIEVVAVDH